MWIIKIIKIKCFYPPRILNEHWCIYSCLQIPHRDNWFQYVHRVYATAINFPCISTLIDWLFGWLIDSSFHSFILSRDGAGAGRDETIDLEVGEQHLVQYSSVSHLVEGGAVRLS